MTKGTDDGIGPPGPLTEELPPPPDVATRLALTERLQGHTTAANWLPRHVWPKLDELREEQLRLRRQVSAELKVLRGLEAKFKKEDAEHTGRLRQAHRVGTPASPEDHRTPVEQRAAERRVVQERLWAGVHVFADHADLVIRTLREQEDEWLADLRSRLAPAHEKRRRAEALVVEAKTEEFELYRLGQWLQANADDQGFGRQPAPSPQRPPDRVSSDFLKGALERPWHRARPWSGTRTEAG